MGLHRAGNGAKLMGGSLIASSLKKPFDPMEVSQLATSLSEKWFLKRRAEMKMNALEALVQKRTADLTHAALHDKLTGLPNRAMLPERLAACLQRRVDSLS